MDNNDVAQNEFYMKGELRQTEKAEDAHIQTLCKTVFKQNKTIENLRNKLSKARKILFEKGFDTEELNEEEEVEKDGLEETQIDEEEKGDSSKTMAKKKKEEKIVWQKSKAMTRSKMMVRWKNRLMKRKKMTVAKMTIVVLFQSGHLLIHHGILMMIVFFSSIKPSRCLGLGSTGRARR